MALFKRVNFSSFKLSTDAQKREDKSKLSEYPPGALIPPEVLHKRIAERESEQSFEALRRKVEKADEEWRRKEEMERLIAERRGRLQDHGCDQELGYLCFKLLYDVNREALKVILQEAHQLRPRDPLEVLLNARVSVMLQDTRNPNHLIPAQPKLALLNKIMASQNLQLVRKGAKLSGKTPSVDPSSSSIYWRTNKPVWNEDFTYEKIQNRQLKHLEVVFTLVERHSTLLPQPPREAFVGEVRIPLIKLYKRLAGVSGQAGVPVEAVQESQGAVAPEVSGNLNQKTVNHGENEAEDGGERTPTREGPERVEIDLPRTKPLGEKEAVARWLEGIMSPTPGVDGEMEELQSICNSEAVRDQLVDPELMDSVSVRELRLLNAEVKSHLDKIKELATPPSAQIEPRDEAGQQATADDNANEDSEPELPECQRPFVIRTLEGWHFINRVPGLRPCYGTLEIGLNHEQNLGKILVSIIKGKDMYAPDGSLMEVWVSVQKKRRVCKKSTPFSAVGTARSSSRSRNSHTEPVAITEKAGKLQRTSVRCDTAEPVWDNRFTFNVTKENLLNVFFDILVYNRESVIGGVRIGHSAGYRALHHWAKMIKRPGVWAFCTYTLQ